MKFKDLMVGEWFQDEDQMHFVYLKTPLFNHDDSDYNAIADCGLEYGYCCYFGSETDIVAKNQPSGV